MGVIQLLLLSILLYGITAIAALLLNERAAPARWVSGAGGLLASLVAATAAALALAGRAPVLLQLPGTLPFGRLTLELDPLSAFMAVVIALLGAAASLYSISYTQAYTGRSLGILGFLTNLFMASMLLVVTISNAFYFLLFWELMTLTSYFLVIFEHEKKASVQAGYLYMLVAHAGTALIMLAFFAFYMRTGSFDFAAFRQAGLSPAATNLVFLLTLLGFGAKAGVVPLHIWLPRAHPAAPSHISALLSGVMIKTAIYGILRVNLDFITGPSWWGFVVLALGGISMLLGVLYALAEKDLKRLLAYSSVENIGIILLGVGVALLGVAYNRPALSVLGLLAALYHLANHAFFKGLLFLGAGSVVFRLHTKNLNAMGGLARRMPWTGLAFLTGALAVSAIPPLNGFVSEWFAYQAFFTAANSSIIAVQICAPLFAVLLAIAGALTALCFVKAYGGAFTGPARSPAAGAATEAPPSMLAGMAFLALGCLALGIGAPLFVPLVGAVAAATLDVAPLQLAGGLQVFPGAGSPAVLSMPWIAVLLAGLLVVPLLVVALLRGFRAGRRTDVEPWSCGYGYAAVMSTSAGSFDQPVRFTFQPLYLLRVVVAPPLHALAAFSKRVAARVSVAEPVLERAVAGPVSIAVNYLSRHVQALQMGDIRVYCFYIVLTLAILLIVAVR